LCADTFFPPGELIDFWGFQWIRDTDVDGQGHNSNYAAYAANAILNVLNDTQKGWILDHSYTQVGVLNISSISLANMTSSTYDGLVYGRLPFQMAVRDSRALNMVKSRVVKYFGSMYLLAGRVAISRAKLFVRLKNSLNPTQLQTLNSYTGFYSFPSTSTDTFCSKANGEYVGLMYKTVAGDFLAWFKGNQLRDAYFAPERVASYFGLFYLKDIISLERNALGLSTTIDSALTGNYGLNLQKLLNGDQRPFMTNLLNSELPYAYKLYYARSNITSLLRGFVSGSVNETLILSFAKQIGEYDGAISYFAALALNGIKATLNQTQVANFASLIEEEIPKCEGYYYLSYNLPMPAVNPCFVTYFVDDSSNCESFYDTVTATEGSLTITSVDTIVFLGGTISVFWSSYGTVSSTVGVYLYQGQSFVTVLAVSVPTSAGQYQGNIETNFVDKMKTASIFRVKVVDLAFPAIFAYSSQLVVKGTISSVQVSPVSTPAINVGGQMNIQWIYYTWSAKVNIYLVKESSVITVASLVSSSASSMVTFKTTLSSTLCPGNYQLKLVDAADSSIYSYSTTFAIKAKITVSNPASGATVILGKAFNVTWSMGSCYDTSMQVSIDVYKGTSKTALSTSYLLASAGKWTGTLSSGVSTGPSKVCVSNYVDETEIGCSAPFRIASKDDVSFGNSLRKRTAERVCDTLLWLAVLKTVCIFMGF
jgi:hypothetical protein